MKLAQSGAVALWGLDADGDSTSTSTSISIALRTTGRALWGREQDKVALVHTCCAAAKSMHNATSTNLQCLIHACYNGDSP